MEDVKFSLTVVLDKEKNKLLYAIADNHFTDTLLSFLTLPLGRIIKIFNKHYGDEAPTIGSLSSLYQGLANLDTSHFVSDAAKLNLLNPRSSFDVDCGLLKLDISHSPPAVYFFCSKCKSNRFRSVSLYYDKIGDCDFCDGMMSKEVVEESSEHASSYVEVFTSCTAAFLISEDLRILPSYIGLVQLIKILGITYLDKAEPIKVNLGFNEILKLLKASLTSPTPLSDIILNKTTTMGSAMRDYLHFEDNPDSWKFVLKLVLQNSTGKLLYAHAKEDFVNFLISILCIPLGKAEHLLADKTCFKAIDNMYRSVAGEYLSDPELTKPSTTTKHNTIYRLTELKLCHGCISDKHILPLTEDSLPDCYTKNSFSCNSVMFPYGKGRYLKRTSQTYQVMNDLTVVPYCTVSILSSLRERKILVSDLKEAELKIGVNQALRILRASLTSTSALSDALLSHLPIKKLEY